MPKLRSHPIQTFRAALCAAALSLALSVSATQALERMWVVPCGLPQQNLDFTKPPIVLHLDDFPWDGGGHLQAKMLHRIGKGQLITEMWLLSRSVGWWRLKTIRVHPDDWGKLTDSHAENLKLRQIVESPFLAHPAVVRSIHPEEEELVDGQILALLPNASRLRCAGWPSDTVAERVFSAQRALLDLGYDPGPVDGLMGPRTRAALRAFQVERGLKPDGELDDAILELLNRKAQSLAP